MGLKTFLSHPSLVQPEHSATHYIKARRRIRLRSRRACPLNFGARSRRRSPRHTDVGVSTPRRVEGEEAEEEGVEIAFEPITSSSLGAYATMKVKVHSTPQTEELGPTTDVCGWHAEKVIILYGPLERSALP